MMSQRFSVSLSKCWQTPEHSLVFQASIFDGKERTKGFLLILCEKSKDPVRFSLQKPAHVLPAGGAAMLIRKHIPHGAITALALTSDHKGHGLLRLTMTGRGSDGSGSLVFIGLDIDGGPEINIIKDGVSLARLRPNAQYTVAKSAPVEYLALEDISEAGFQAWLGSLLPSKVNTADDVTSGGVSGALPGFQREARDRVSRRLRTLKKTYAQEENKLPDHQDLKLLQRKAELLKSYLWMVRPDMFQLKLDATMTGDEPIIIELNPELSAGANLEALFTRIKKTERGIRIGEPRLEEMRLLINQFESALETLRSNELSLAAADALLKTLALSKKSVAKQSQGASSASESVRAGRIFKSATGDMMILGRNAAESDQVVKAAKSQDWWFHIAGGGHGSHVIVPGNKHKETLPAILLREAAILALHYSDRSESKEGEVYVSRRRNIKKRKGMPPGLWQIDRAETVTIRYTPDELSAIFRLNIQ